jgi:hypothetical protein
MQLSLLLSAVLGMGLSSAFPTASAPAQCGPLSTIDGLVQGGYRLAYALDSKNYTLLGQVFTDDVVYDSSALGPYGGVSKGKKAAIAAVQAANTNAMMEHLVTNLYVLEMQSPTQARVVTE